MDKKLKNALSDIFNKYSFELTENGKIDPTYFLIKDNFILPLRNVHHIDFNLYANFVINQATQRNADALALILENSVITGYKEDKDIQAIINGSLSVSDHPDSASYLILIYMTSKGAQEALFGKIEKDIRGIKFVSNSEWVCDFATNLGVKLVST